MVATCASAFEAAPGDTVDERLRIFEDRLKAMDKRLGKCMDEVRHQIEDVEYRLANET